MCGKLSDVNFNYLQASSCSSYQNLLWQKFDLSQKYKQQQSWSNKNRPHKFPIYWIWSNTAANKQFFVIYFPFHNFKLKTEVIDKKSLLVTELNKVGVIGLLHFYKGILQSHVTEFPFEKLQYVQKDTFYCIREKEWYFDTKSDDKEFM